MPIPCPAPLTIHVTVPPFVIVTSSGTTTLTGGVCGCGAPNCTVASRVDCRFASSVAAPVRATPSPSVRTMALIATACRIVILELLSSVKSQGYPRHRSWEARRSISEQRSESPVVAMPCRRGGDSEIPARPYNHARLPVAPGTRLGVYDVTAQIGEGGMGEVYRATDTKLKRQVAIKILPLSFAADPDRLARFQREAEVLASLNHPSIAAIYGFEEGPAEGGPAE